jgi:hypothetical protein
MPARLCDRADGMLTPGLAIVELAGLDVSFAERHSAV